MLLLSQSPQPLEIFCPKCTSYLQLHRCCHQPLWEHYQLSMYTGCWHTKHQVQNNHHHRYILTERKSNLDELRCHTFMSTSQFKNIWHIFENDDSLENPWLNILSILMSNCCCLKSKDALTHSFLSRISWKTYQHSYCLLLNIFCHLNNQYQWCILWEKKNCSNCSIHLSDTMKEISDSHCFWCCRPTYGPQSPKWLG